jgi:hypothetical protein
MEPASHGIGGNGDVEFGQLRSEREAGGGVTNLRNVSSSTVLRAFCAGAMLVPLGYNGPE